MRLTSAVVRLSNVVSWGLQDRHAVLVDDPQLQFGFAPADRKQHVSVAHTNRTPQSYRTGLTCATCAVMTKVPPETAGETGRIRSGRLRPECRSLSLQKYIYVT